MISTIILLFLTILVFTDLLLTPSQIGDGDIEVHIICHSHIDVGWLRSP